MCVVACVDNGKSSVTHPSETLRTQARIEKVLEIRRQLHEGRYDVAERLDVALDRVLEDLLG
jgi:hypothetical protein